MSLRIDIAFDGVEVSEALRARIAERAHRLEHYADDIDACHVVVRACGRRYRSGNRYSVHARASLHGRDIEAGGDDVPDDAHADPYIVVDRTFDVLRRRIEDHVRKRRGDVKRHAGS